MWPKCLGFHFILFALRCVSHLVIIFKASAVGEWYWCENDVAAWEVQRGFSSGHSFRYTSPTGRDIDWVASCVCFAPAFCGCVSDRALQGTSLSLLAAAERQGTEHTCTPRWGCTGACGTSLWRSHLTLGDELFPPFCWFPRKTWLWLLKVIPFSYSDDQFSLHS